MKASTVERSLVAMLVVSALGLSACKGEVVGGGSASGQGTSPTTGSSSSMSGGDGADGGGGAGPADCNAYVDEAPLSQVKFTVHNGRSTPIDILENYCAKALSIALPGGEVKSAELASYDVTCPALEKGAQRPEDCIGPSIQTIAAGDTFVLWWSGLVYDEVVLPATCYTPSSFPDSGACVLGKTPPVGELEAHVDLYDSAGPCPNNVCELTATQKFKYGTDTEVLIEVK